MKITEHNADEVEVHRWVAEASDLGLPVGRFPKWIETDLGNGRPFILSAANEGKWTYLQVNGCLTLTVFND